MLIITAFTGCKDDEQPEPANEEVVYEDWTKVSSKVIHVSSRNVISMGVFDDILHIQCLNSFYHLDSNLNRISNSLKSLNKEPPYYKRPKIGKEWTIHEEDAGLSRLFFNVFSTKRPVSQHRFYVSIDSLNISSFGTFTAVDDNGEFGILYNNNINNNATYFYNQYKFNKTPFHHLQSLYSIELGTFPTPSATNYFQWASRIDDVSFCDFYRRAYRIEGERITTIFNHGLRNVSKYRGKLVAIADYHAENPDIESQLLISNDLGLSWTSLFTGRTLMRSILKVIDNEIFLLELSGSHILVLNADDKTYKEINLEGTDAFIKDLVKLGDKAVIGTDHGLYYKSWDSFLNK